MVCPDICIWIEESEQGDAGVIICVPATSFADPSYGSKNTVFIFADCVMVVAIIRVVQSKYGKV